MMAWQPAANIGMLHLRARLLQNIRQFFQERAVLEVETPLVCHATGTDPQLAFFSTEYHRPPHRQTLFLQTSPEFAMKRLLASGCGSIFQICKAFRNGEAGRFHNPEFTLLEWYRVGFDLAQLMDEIETLVKSLFPVSINVHRVSYQNLFEQYTGLNPLVFCLNAYQTYARSNDLPEAIDICGQDHALWLDIIFSHKIQPHMTDSILYFVFAYPACQSSLAIISPQNPLTVERVELFMNGIELGNGYHELVDAAEQQRRFNKEIEYRQQQCLASVTEDKRLLAALASGLPDCSGMAIGLDRLLMIITASDSLADTLSFPIDSA